MERTQAYIIAKRCAQLLKERFKVNDVYIFGSVVGNGVWHDRSDIDIAVEGLSPEDYIPALNAAIDLLPYGLKIDLFSLEDMPAELKNHIKSTSISLCSDEGIGTNDYIELELNNLKRIAQELDAFLEQTTERQPNAMELAGVGAYLQGFYTGVERIFERIAVTLDGGLPTGENRHTLLLQQKLSIRRRDPLLSATHLHCAY